MDENLRLEEVVGKGGEKAQMACPAAGLVAICSVGFFFVAF